MINKIFNLLIALLLLAVLFLALDNSYTDLTKKEEITAISIENIAGGPDIRGGIFSDYVFSFELLSLLLLAALIGALYIARKEV